MACDQQPAPGRRPVGPALRGWGRHRVNCSGCFRRAAALPAAVWPPLHNPAQGEAKNSLFVKNSGATLCLEARLKPEAVFELERSVGPLSLSLDDCLARPRLCVCAASCTNVCLVIICMCVNVTCEYMYACIHKCAYL